MSDQCALPDDYYMVDSDNVTDRVIRKVGDNAYYVTSRGEFETFEISTLRNFRPIRREAEAWRAIRDAHEQSMRSMYPATSWFILHNAGIQQFAHLK